MLLQVYLIPNGLYVPPSAKVITAACNLHWTSRTREGFHPACQIVAPYSPRVPNRGTDVIGSSRFTNLMNNGALGVASRSYENLILRYLRNDPAKYGVIFHGNDGIEKYGVMFPCDG